MYQASLPRTYDRRAVLYGIALLQAALFIAVLVPSVPSLVRLPAVVAYLTFVPGLLLSSLLGIDDRTFATKTVYVVGLSFIFIMALGATISLFYPLLGIDRPLSPVPLMTTLLVLVTGLAALVVLRNETLTVTVPIHSLMSPVPLALLLLPFMSIFGTVYYNTLGSNIALVVMLTLIAFIPMVLTTAYRNTDETFSWYALTIWTVSLALVYHGGSLLPPYFGGVKAGYITMQSGIWLPNGHGLAGILPNVVLYPTYSILGGVSLAVETTLVNPFLVSFLPVVLFEFFRRHTSQLYAFLSCCVFMFSFPYYVLYPVGGRVATPVLFLALMGLTLSDRSFSHHIRSGIALAFSAGVIVSHYGTAWVAMFALMGAFAFYQAVRIWDKLKKTDSPLSSASSFSSLLTFAPSIPTKGWQCLDDRDNRDTSLSLSFVGVYSVLGIGWYIYTSEGVKFFQLAIKIVDAIQGIIYTKFGGSAANVASKDYGSQIVATSRILYILLGALLATGVAVAVYRRMVEEVSIVDDGYLALGVGFASMLFGSMLPSGKGFAVARVMMIVFTFTLPFILIGADALVSTVETIIDRVGRNFDRTFPSPSVIVVVLLAIFLILNSGVAAALLQEGFSPSTKLGQERLADSEEPIERARATSCHPCTIDTHVWILRHSTQDYPVYGDSYVRAHPDFYRTAIESRVGFNPSKGFFTLITSVNQTGFDNGYILLVSKNLDTGGIYKTKYTWVSFDNLSMDTEDQAIVYTSGFTRIYKGQKTNKSEN